MWVCDRALLRHQEWKKMSMVRRLAVILGMILASLMPLNAQEKKPSDKKAAQPGVEKSAKEVEAAEQELRAAEQAYRSAQEQLNIAAQKLAELHRLRGEHERQVIGRRIAWYSNRAAIGIVLKTEADETSDAAGATVAAVTPGGPAEEAGIKAGDVITSVDGDPLAGRYEGADPDESAPAMKLIDKAHGLKEGDKVRIEYRRVKETKSVTITARRIQPSVWAWSMPPEAEEELARELAEAMTPPAPPAPPAPGAAPAPRAAPASRPAAVVSPAPVAPPAPPAPPITLTAKYMMARWNDMDLVSLNSDLGYYFGANDGVLVVTPPANGSLALRSGDVIVRIGESVPETPLQAVRALRAYEPGETITVSVIRKGEKVTLSTVAPEPGSTPPPGRRSRHGAPPHN